jgi:O-antigen/teichoic acid export membrane protein
MILIGGVAGVLFLRGLFGNLLSALGKAHAGFAISLLALGLNLALNYRLIPSLGLGGAAITSASVMWFTALLSMAAFYWYFRRSAK